MNLKRLSKAALVAVVATGIMGAVTPVAAAPESSTAINDRVVVQSEDGYSETYSNKRGVRVCDTSWDGWNVYSQFYVRNDSVQKRVETTNGAGSCAESGIYDDGIDRHNTCLNRPMLPDTCTAYQKVPW